MTALRLVLAVPPRWLFLKLSTDEGIAGWGEPIVEGRVATVRAAVEELGEQITGRDPFRIEDHFQVMWRGGFYRGGPVLCSAISGIGFPPLSATAALMSSFNAAVSRRSFS